MGGAVSGQSHCGKQCRVSSQNTSTRITIQLSNPLLGICLSQRSFVSIACPMLAFWTNFKQNMFILLPVSNDGSWLTGHPISSAFLSCCWKMVSWRTFTEEQKTHSVAGSQAACFALGELSHPRDGTTIPSLQKEHPSNLIAFHWSWLFSFPTSTLVH